MKNNPYQATTYELDPKVEEPLTIVGALLMVHTGVGATLLGYELIGLYVGATWGQIQQAFLLANCINLIIALLADATLLLTKGQRGFCAHLWLIIRSIGGFLAHFGFVWPFALFRSHWSRTK